MFIQKREIKGQIEKGNKIQKKREIEFQIEKEYKNSNRIWKKQIERRKFLRHRVNLEEVFMNKLDLSRSADTFCKLTGRTVLKNPTFYEEHIHNKSKIG